MSVILAMVIAVLVLVFWRITLAIAVVVLVALVILGLANVVEALTLVVR